MKFYRQKNNLTQERIAKKLGISVSAYNMIENGNRGISLLRAKQLEKILNVSIDEIFFDNKFHNKQNKKTKEVV
ncbi:MAG: helix-turn-helix transcriptional regulator [Clostridium tyrobutyricum]|jgi:putative transcriptional regulator|uniref:helix-turn-helix transcriptional regulator n=1 Tax=Clostridium tyrobutyricum TaxID=1519 RepID=UPI002013310F|nr:helix-turn-helix transcriptional regulator [Clostridium tyrobutyricum]MBR9648693.1 helix-turn-helix transcriptional regulator [Clostridium tyrobutyricum]MCH4199233.1 helix-turn-helix transcriptional regulator [Clostridium tyrobutyricum]MCH4236565.1 helix-turn-helix transcriptional regulator [Clostridium tyrobutyricum]MCH4258119.1 helix-turn-helix transcriptional regulator [Clostridium tyrobutyricum]MCI1239158.1 helix-turn-helix transcriptional regulator [Clostridium tyrobutyricum]